MIKPDCITQALQLVQKEPHIVVPGIIVVLVILWLTADPEPNRCAAKRAGCRCVHDEDHRGSHRDEFGDYWN